MRFAEIHHPKVESYGEYLYLILHGIDFKAREHAFRTQEVDFFLGPQFLVTLHRNVAIDWPHRDNCGRNERVLGEGPAALFYRIVDTTGLDRLLAGGRQAQRLAGHTRKGSVRPAEGHARQAHPGLQARRGIAAAGDYAAARCRRATRPAGVSADFRSAVVPLPPDVHDHLVRLSDEAVFFQDRISSLLDAHLSNVSNQLNGVMKVLTIISTIFMPMTVLTGLYGMNVPLPHLPGGEHAQFWWILAIMASITAAMLMFFRRRGWL